MPTHTKATTMTVGTALMTPRGPVPVRLAPDVTHTWTHAGCSCGSDPFPCARCGRPVCGMLADLATGVGACCRDAAGMREAA